MICRGVSWTLNKGVSIVAVLLAVMRQFDFVIVSLLLSSLPNKQVPCGGIYLPFISGGTGRQKQEGGGWSLCGVFTSRLVMLSFLLPLMLLGPKTSEKVLRGKHVSFLSMLNLNSYDKFLKICASEMALIIHVCFIKKRTNCL